MWLDVQTERCLEQTTTGLWRIACDLPERVRVVDAEVRICRLRVVEDILRVEANHEVLRFRDSERLAQVRIETVTAQTNDGVLPQCSPLTGLWILKHNY